MVIPWACLSQIFCGRINQWSDIEAPLCILNQEKPCRSQSTRVLGACIAVHRGASSGVSCSKPVNHYLYSDLLPSHENTQIQIAPSSLCIYSIFSLHVLPLLSACTPSSLCMYSIISLHMFHLLSACTPSSLLKVLASETQLTFSKFAVGFLAVTYHCS